MFKKLAAVAMALSVVAVAGAAQAGDAKAGKKVFNKCKACHVADKETNRVGPHLVGIVGREVGKVDGYKYSDSMIEWGAGKTWDEATLFAYLHDPKGVVPGTKMSFAGLKKDDDVNDVIEFLKSGGK